MISSPELSKPWMLPSLSLIHVLCHAIKRFSPFLVIILLFEVTVFVLLIGIVLLLDIFVVLFVISVVAHVIKNA